MPRASKSSEPARRTVRRKPLGRLPRADFDVLLIVGLEKGAPPSELAPFKTWWGHYAFDFLEVATIVSARNKAHPVLGRPDDVYVLVEGRSPLDAEGPDGSLRSLFQDFKDEGLRANLILAGRGGPLMTAVARDARKAGIRTFLLDEQTSGDRASVHAAGARAIRYDPERLLD